MIYSGGSPFAQNLNLAVPIDDLRAMIWRLPSRHKVGKASRPAREVVNASRVALVIVAMLGGLVAVVWLPVG